MCFDGQSLAFSQKSSSQKRPLCFLITALGGIFAGCGAKLLDLYTTNLGNVFSRLSVWVLFCTALAVFSATPHRAAVHVFSFCIGMIGAYYGTAKLCAAYYSPSAAFGWTVIALFSPLFGFLIWQVKKGGVLSFLLCAGILFCLPASAAVFFDRVRISDLFITILTAAVLFCGRSSCAGKK